MTLTVGSLFSGIGGIDLGLERAGMAVLWQCEKDKDARSVLQRRWPEVPVYDDVETLNGRTVATVDVLCGGFPCQDLSVAGRRAGLAGERSGLFHEFMRLADELAPTWVLVENVPGLLSSNDGRDMGIVLGTLADLGYGWCYRVLDAQYFGVAQRRRRVFIVGCAGGAAGAAQVLLEPSSCDGDSAPSRTAGKSVAALTAHGVGTCGADDNQGQAGHLVPAVARCLTTSNEPIDGETETFLPMAFMWQAGGNNDASGAFAEDFTPTLPKSQTSAVAFSENQRGEIYEMDVMNSVTSGGGKPGQGYPAIRQDVALRRLTPTECERLQGFPDGWTSGQTDGHRYRQLGNAVCVPVAEWIGRRIVEAAA